jgi:hypothetical protein
MPKTFGDYAEGWVFCGYAILSYKWERMAVLAKTDQERDVLDRVAVKMRNEMRKFISRTNEDRAHKIGFKPLNADEVIAQTNGDRYASPLIGRRFQVMESFIRGTYYIADHARDDLLMRVAGPGSDVLRFSLKADAEERIKGFTNTGDQFTEPSGDATPDQHEKDSDDMARTPKTNGAAMKAANAADKALDTKPVGKKAAAKATDAAAQMAAVKKEAKKNGKAVVAAAPEPARKGRGLSTGGTMSSMFRDLIMEGKKTDAVIHSTVEQAFGKKIPKNAVTHYRGILQIKGMSPPAAKA